MTSERLMLCAIGKIEVKEKFFNSQINELREVVDKLSLTEIRKLRHCIQHDGDIRNREFHATLSISNQSKYEDALLALYGNYESILGI